MKRKIIKIVLLPNNAGFTKIEFIMILSVIGIAILGIIFFGRHSKNDSGIKSCQQTTTNLQTYYNEEVKQVTADNPLAVHLNFNLVENAIAAAGGTYTDGSAVKITVGIERERKPVTRSRIYTGLCPSGGQYQIDLKEEGTGEQAKTALSVACTYSGHTPAQVNNVQIGLNTLKDLLNKPSSGAPKYFANNPKAVSLFSTDMLSAGSDSGKAIEEINSHFRAMGLDPLKIGSWRINRLMSGSYALFWSEQNAEALDTGAAVRVTSYQLETQKYYSGTAKVKAQNGIHILSIPNETVNWPETTF